jgi:hypothetical protein
MTHNEHYDFNIKITMLKKKSQIEYEHEHKTYTINYENIEGEISTDSHNIYIKLIDNHNNLCLYKHRCSISQFGAPPHIKKNQIDDMLRYCVDNHNYRLSVQEHGIEIMFDLNDGDYHNFTSNFFVHKQ